MSPRSTSSPRAIGHGRVVALILIVLAIAGLGYLRLARETPIEVPPGAEAGDLSLEPCDYNGHPAECGTVVVPENRADPDSRLIALPVTRFPSDRATPSDPVFYLQGGPGIANEFAHAERFTADRDVVTVGYRGVEGSSVLDCPEVVAALKGAVDLLDEELLRRYSEAYGACARRLAGEGVDLDGYTLSERVEDLETVRIALGHDRLNLLSESVGARTAMIYSWLHPESIHRSVMVAVNPPGHFLWDPETTDGLLAHYSDLCSENSACAGRTSDLAVTMRQVASNMPSHWLFLPIAEGNVKLGSFYAMMETTSEVAPLNAPMAIDSWLSAAEGDPSGFWFLSLFAEFVFPEAFTWGEVAATASIDSSYVRRYYEAGGDPGSILGNPGTEFNWGQGGWIDEWPESSRDHALRQVQESEVETLLIGGTVDFATPSKVATEELLPHLRNGHQVVLAELGHSTDFWTYQPEAADRLITRFFDTGDVDASGYTYQEVDFTPEVTQTALGKGISLTMIGFGSIVLLLLLWMPVHVRRRGGFGRKSGVVVRLLVVPLVFGFGGWFLGLIGALTLWQRVPLDDQALSIASTGLPIALGSYLAWVQRGWPSKVRRIGLVVALTGAVAGGWAGFNVATGLLSLVTTIIGATAFTNLALIVVSVWHDMSRRRIPVSRPPARSDVPLDQPELPVVR